MTDKPKIALISGITGQDGAYLAEFLIDKGYIVHGIKRRSSSFNTERIDPLFEDKSLQNKRLFLHYGDMTDSTNLIRLMQETAPDEIYNLAAQSHVHVSFDTPEYTANADALGTLRLLEAIRILRREDNVKFYQASTSELYGLVQETPQNENTPFYPRSPYAAAKLYAYWIVVNYREAYNIFACNGILFNHESPLRGETFVTKKITMQLAQILFGLEEKLWLGNLDALRDWGHAKDYIKAQWLMLQQETPEDYVIASGTQYSVRDFVNIASKFLGIEIEWRGTGHDEKGYVKSIDKSQLPEGGQITVGQELVAVSEHYFRPTEVETLLGDASKAKNQLGWQPEIAFETMVEEMIAYDLEKAKQKARLSQ